MKTQSPLKIRLEVLRTSIDGVRGAQIVAFHGNDFAASVTLGHLNSQTGSITNLFVRLGYRNRRVAKRLLDECSRIAREHDCKTIGLSVQPKNPAKFFYPNVGFVLAYEYADKSMLFTKTL